MADDRITVSGTENVEFPELGLVRVPARVDTGAKTSAVWASNIAEHDGGLRFVVFGPGCDLFTGEKLHVQHYSQKIVTSSNGAKELRYVVRLLVTLGGRKVRASFTLADRSLQVYPVLVGRNILRGKFIVDVNLKQADKRNSENQG